LKKRNQINQINKRWIWFRKINPLELLI